MKYLCIAFIILCISSCNKTFDLTEVKPQTYLYDQLPKKVQIVMLDSLNKINKSGFDYFINLDNYSVKIILRAKSGYIADVVLEDLIVINNNIKLKFEPYGYPYIFKDSIMYYPIISNGQYDTNMVKNCKYDVFILNEYLK